jgi:hypothetical protein
MQQGMSDGSHSQIYHQVISIVKNIKTSFVIGSVAVTIK